MKEKNSFFKYEGVNYLLPFILITACFALWGFANDVTNPMVKAFSKIFRMSVTQGTLTQVAFYGGYFASGGVPVHRRAVHGIVLAFPDRVFHPHLRPQLPGDQREPVHPRDG